MTHLAALAAVLPLVGAFVAPLFALVSRRALMACFFFVLGACALVSIGLTAAVIRGGALHYAFGGWPAPFGIEYVADSISCGITLLIAHTAFFVGISVPRMIEGWPALRQGAFCSLYLMLLTGLIGMVLTGDLFNLYVFLEISALSAYALLATGGNHAVVSVFRYVLVGTIGAALYLLGLSYLYGVTGTLNMADMAARIEFLLDSRAVVVGLGMIVVGFAIKAAVFPMHGWLPDVYAHASPVVVAFVSAVMTKVAAYALFRILFCVFGHQGPAREALSVLGALAAAGIIAAGVLAMAQRDVRRMLAYSSVGQLCYIVLGFSIGNTLALTGALLHVFNHAVMKGCLFLIAGGVVMRRGNADVSSFIGTAKEMPWTMAAFTVAALSMIGIPPLAGFFSKYYLIWGAVSAGRFLYAAVFLVSGLLALVYFFRLIEAAYFRKRDSTDANNECEKVPAAFGVPILVMAALLVVMGVWHREIIVHAISGTLRAVGAAP